MSEGHDRPIALPSDWQQQRDEIAAAGLDPWRTIAARLAVRDGAYSDQCDYRPDPEVWAFYRTLEATP